jgi:protein gp37
VNSFPFGRPERYKGPLRLIEKEFSVNYGTHRTIFIENCNDLFSIDVPEVFIQRVLAHCSEWPENIYVIQTKNPRRMAHYYSFMPPNVLFGTTIESSWYYRELSMAPLPLNRVRGMKMLPPTERKFITVEPIMDGDMDILSAWIDQIRPEFVNIGADSKNNHLPEPPAEKVRALIAKLTEYGIEIREKHNLERLM